MWCCGCVADFDVCECVCTCYMVVVIAGLVVEFVGFVCLLGVRFTCVRLLVFLLDVIYLLRKWQLCGLCFG